MRITSPEYIKLQQSYMNDFLSLFRDVSHVQSIFGFIIKLFSFVRVILTLMVLHHTFLQLFHFRLTFPPVPMFSETFLKLEMWLAAASLVYHCIDWVYNFRINSICTGFYAGGHSDILINERSIIFQGS